MDIARELKRATTLHRSGKLKEAHAIYRAVLDASPDHPDALHLSGLIAHQQGDHETARRLIQRAIEHCPNHPAYHSNLGAVWRAVGNMEAALNHCRKAVSLDSRFAEAWYNMGSVHHGMKMLDEAVSCYRKAVGHHPRYVDAWNNLAAALNEMGEHDSAIDCCKKLLSMDPGYAPAHNNLGNALKNKGELDEAALCYQKAIDILPDQSEFFNNLANVYMDSGNVLAAERLYKRSIRLKPDFAESYNGLGTAFKAIGRLREALACFEKSIQLRPGDVQGYHNMGNAYFEMAEYPKALLCYDHALKINDGLADTHLNMGFVLREVGKPQAELQAYHKALDIDPNHEKAVVHIVHYLMQSCDWQTLGSFAEKMDRLTQRTLDRGGQPDEMPFLNLARTDDVRLNYQVARSWSVEIEKLYSRIKIDRPFMGSAKGSTGSSNRRITIGYLSNNFKNHPTAHLIAGIFSRHDHNRFKVNCYSFGEDDQSVYRKKIQRTCDCFVDIRDMDHLTAARQIAEDGVDILVDLVGFMKNNRIQIPALKPTPVAVRWLGMAGTTGADFFDYLITHPIVTPEEDAPYYTEAFAYLPDCYQVNDQDQKICDGDITYDTNKLPSDAFIFCCFCSHYKITPVIFQVWMNLLKQVPNSVLWLLKGNGRTRENLTDAARSYGIGTHRLIYADKVSRVDHIKRLQLADLALDTPLVNGAATTSDALWAGVPVVTTAGNHFASRMSACILSAIGLAEMICPDLTAYERMCLRLASESNTLLRMKQQLKENRATQPLFDTGRFVRNLESAFRKMWERYLANEKPKMFYVENG